MRCVPRARARVIRLRARGLRRGRTHDIPARLISSQRQRTAHVGAHTRAGQPHSDDNCLCTDTDVVWCDGVAIDNNRMSASSLGQADRGEDVEQLPPTGSFGLFCLASARGHTCTRPNMRGKEGHATAERTSEWMV